MADDSLQSQIDALEAERQDLDRQLDEVLERFAEYEEQMNIRWRSASPEQIQDLMTERAVVEEELGIVVLVERIDALRDNLIELRRQMEAHQAA
jgi:hypothetical protein